MKTLLFKYIENLTTKKGKILDKNSDSFHISAQNIDFWWGGSNEYPQSMFFKQTNVYPVNPSFTI